MGRGFGIDKIAIVAMACRLPGADSPEAAWALLAQGRHAITESPPERWATRQKIALETGSRVHNYPKWGGFLDGIDQFDPGFFGMSLREARLVDPQQRLLLQTAWSALENTGHDPRALKGSRTGVFVGISTSDYMQRQLLDGEVLRIDAYSGLGSAQSIAANRLSHFFDFHGPSMAVDTACSSALVALHLARQSLARGECDLALVGGVNAILSPLSTISFSKARMLAADGRCKSFSQAADGYVRSEGCVMLVLARETDARRAGSRVQALLRGSAVNQDGASLSITTPTVAAQQAVMQAALADAGLPPDAVDLIEAHGTGTRIGDATELAALSAVYGAAPVVVGSAKPNFGHLEAASGLVGVLKAVLSLRHAAVPALPGLTDPILPPEGAALHLALKATPLNRPDRPLRAGVSSFGFGGTNAHVILEAVAPRPAKALEMGVFPVSSHAAQLLRDTAADYAALLRTNPALPAATLAASAARSRSGHPLRAAIAFTDRDSLLAGLDRLATMPDVPAAPTGGVGFCFAGQGAQFPGMCAALLDQDAGFRASIAACDAVIRQTAGWSLTRLLTEADPGIDDTALAQPALFAVELALARRWIAVGVRPDVVLGHSLGEIVAACIAGVMSDQTALRLVLARGRLMAQAPGTGAMLSLTGDPQQLAEVLEQVGAAADAPEVAGRNTARNVTLSGCANALAGVQHLAETSGLRARPLAVSHAFHSRLMQPMLDDFRSEIAGLEFHPAQIPLISTVTGAEIAAGQVPGADHWVQQVRAPVLFRAATEALVARGIATCIEIAPQPQLTPWLREAGLTVIPALPRGRADAAGLQSGLTAVWKRGLPVDLCPAGAADLPDLPPYRFARSRVWFEPFQPGPGIELRPNAVTPEPVPETGPESGRESGPESGPEYATVLLRQPLTDPALLALLAQHRVAGRAVLPAAFYLDLLAAGARRLCPGDLDLRDIRFPAMLPLAEAQTGTLVVQGLRSGERDWALTLSAVPGDGGAPKLLAQARLLEDPAALPQPLPLPESLPHSLSGAALYTQLADSGLDYGPAFRGLSHADFCPGQARATVTSPGDWPRHVIDPAQLDAALHALAPALRAAEGEAAEGLWVPVSIARLQLSGSLPNAAAVRLALQPGPHFPDLKAFDLTLEDASGRVGLALGGLSIRRLDMGHAAATTGPLFATELLPLPPLVEPEGWNTGWWLLPLAGQALATTLAPLLQAPGIGADMPDPPPRIVALLADAAEMAGQGPDLLADLATHARRLLATTPRPHLLLILRTATPGPEAEALRAALRVIRNEAPDLSCVGLVLPADADPEAIRQALASAATRRDEPDQVLQGRTLAAPRLTPLALPQTGWRPGPARGDSRRLIAGPRGGIANLSLQPADAPTPGPGEVLIAVQAAGLNFRDVLKSLRLYPNRPGMPLWLGDECAGRIVALGAGVTDLALGDAVLAVASSAFSTHALARATAVVPMPAGLSMVDAATIPIAFTTACHALVDLGRLAAGDTVLIHAAAGGVGLAAVQIAHAFGAQVIATASAEKQAFLRGLGVLAVGNSRDLSFVETVRAATQGRGVDIVLNSLSGAAIPASLGLLAPFGRFIEIGKRDIVEDSPLPMRGFHASVSLHALDMELLFALRPAEGQRLLRAVLAAFADGRLHALPHSDFALENAAEAFQHMAQARNIGKVVLTVGPAPIAAPGGIAAALVSGGFGAIGLGLVQHLAAHGVRGFVLLGRSAPSAAAKAQIAALRAGGATVICAAVDVSDAAALRAVIAQADEAGLQVRHVLHAAGVLADALLAEVTPAAIAKVWAPKVGGALALEAATQGLTLDSFVCLGSVASLLGSPGQMAYAAANAAMAAICARRQAQGLAGQALVLGPWQSGMALQDDATLARMTRLGLRPLLPEDGLAQVLKAMALPGPVVVARFAAGESTPLASLAICRGLYGAAKPRARHAPLLAEVMALDPAARVPALAQALAQRLARVMGQGVETLALEAPLEALGFDSLAGLEFGMSVEEDLGLRFPMDAIGAATTLNDLAALLLAAAETAGPGAIAAPAAEPAADPGLNPLPLADRPETLLPQMPEPATDGPPQLRPDIAARLSALKLDAVYDRALGTRLWGRIDGQHREVIDFVAGYGSCLFGHNHPSLVAVLQQGLTAQHPTHAQGAHPAAGEALARGLAVELGGGTQAFTTLLASTGAEVVEAALKHAWAEQRRRLHGHPAAAQVRPVFLAVEGSYHGKTLGALALSDFRLAPIKAGAFRVRLLPRNDPDALRAMLAEETLQTADGPLSQVTAIFAEPVQGEGGVWPLDAAFLQEMRRLADENGFPLVFDEIQCGFWRCGGLSAAPVLGDYHLFGKSLGGGLAKISALLIRSERYVDGFGIVQSSTFGEDAPSSMVALAALRLGQGETAGRVQRAGEMLRSKLEMLQARHPDVVADIRGVGLMQAVQLADLSAKPGLIGQASQHQGLGQLVCSHLLLRHGIRVATSLSAPDTLRLQPAAYVTEAEIDRLIAALDGAFAALQHGDGAYLASHLLQRNEWLECSISWPAPAPLQPAIADPDTPRVAFLSHFADPASLRRWDASWARLSDAACEALVARLAPIVPPTLSAVQKLVSASGAAVEMHLLTLLATSLMIETAMRQGRTAPILNQMQQALEMAEASGCRTAGLGGFLSIVSRNGTRLHSNVGLTTGNALTIAAGVAAVQAAIARHLPGQALRLGVVGAAGNIGSSYLRRLAVQLDDMVLVGRAGSLPRLQAMAATLRADAAAAGRAAPKIELAESLGPLRACNVIVTATNTSTPILFADSLGPGPVVVVDLSVPGDVSPDLAARRPDALVIEGGRIALPPGNACDLALFGLPPNQLYACMAETALLGLEHHPGSFALGEVRMAQIDTISAAAVRHGFGFGDAT
ncbi:type I polyketide synthase [Rhodobacter ferrooxidans]|uniref:KR domain protein n=1 Tax=Rhodobacter ferrooxidans TaxID=371731 RepID=C8RZN9_9RHOB|nr:type I polyketide synthase [Rhodobacter sp. SW2]EEW25836.1 KR domain protein [Rhodobacter sp. SW2]